MVNHRAKRAKQAEASWDSIQFVKCLTTNLMGYVMNGLRGTLQPCSRDFQISLSAGSQGRCERGCTLGTMAVSRPSFSEYGNPGYISSPRAECSIAVG